MKNTDWNKWSAIAEITSSIAVFLTLIYLALQTNQIAKQTELNTSALLSSARQESLNAELGLMYQVLEAGINTADRVQLTQEEADKMTIIVQAMMRIRENLWWQYQSGVLDEATWFSYRNLLVRAINNQPPNQLIWRQMQEQGAFDINFVNEINSLLDIDDGQ